MTAKVSLGEYQYATDSYMGWCTTCEEFTRDCTEPDAQGYDCPVCEQHTVMGAEDALLSETIEVGAGMKVLVRYDILGAQDARKGEEVIEASTWEEVGRKVDEINQTSEDYGTWNQVFNIQVLHGG